MRRLGWLLLAGCLSACGTLPEPFYGDPGTEGARLGTPAAPVLYVPAPDGAMLGDAASGYAADLAGALAAVDVPTVAGSARKSDWRLAITASLAGATVVPSYAIVGPGGKIYGVVSGVGTGAQAWSDGDKAALNAEAGADALLLSKKLAALNAQVQGSNPLSLENRPARVFMGAVSGAPGDGDNALALDMTRDLPGPHSELVQSAAGADFSVTGLIKTSPAKDAQLLVEIDWVVHDSSAREIGQVTQLHVLDPTDITPYWGDVAAAVADQAAAGVNEVIDNAVLHKSPNGAAAAGSGAALEIPAKIALPPPK